MQKHTLLCLGFTFLTGWSSAQVADTTLKNVALRKINQFGNLLEIIASPGLNMTTRASVQQKLETDYLESNEVRFYQDLNNQFGHAQQITAQQYFNQLKVLYPNGGSLLTSDYEMSDIFFDSGHEIYYVMVRCLRNFKGLNALAKKEISMNKVIDYQVKLVEKGSVKIQILGSHLAEGNINQPLGLDKSLAELQRKNIAEARSLEREKQLIHSNDKMVEDLHSKLNNYQELKEAETGRESQNGKTKGEKERERLQAKLEKARLKREIRQAKLERKNLYPYRFNIRLGGGVSLSDSTVNALVATDPNRFKENWNVKLDFLYKFAGLHRDAKGKWERAHATGLFLNYGKQSGKNVYNLIRNNGVSEVDTAHGSRGFMEAEFGVMLKEQFRLSGGAGVMNYYRIRDGNPLYSTQPYYLLTTGLSPRFGDLFEIDFNLSGLIVNERLYARANMNLCLLIKAGKF